MIKIILKRSENNYDFFLGTGSFIVFPFLLALYPKSLLIAWFPGPFARRQFWVAKFLLSHCRRFRLFSHGDPYSTLQRALIHINTDFTSNIPPGIKPIFFDNSNFFEKCSDAKEKDRDLISKNFELTGVTVCRLVEIKGPDILLDALAILKDEFGVQPRWFVFGSGPLEVVLRKKIIDLGLSASVSIENQASDDVLSSALARAELFCLTSRYENFSLACLEAMASGCALVVPPVGYLPTLLSSSNSGVLSQSVQPYEIASSLASLISDRALRVRCIENGQRFAANYTWDASAKKLAELMGI